MAATLKIPTIFTAVDKMSSVVKTINRNIKKSFTGSLTAVRRFDQKVSRTFKKMGRFARLGIGIGAGLVLTDAVTQISGYEQATADLSAVMNTTLKNQQLLSADSKRLGSSTAKSASEVVSLQEAYARLGFTTPEIINMTEGTIAGSIAMNAELSQTAELTGAVVKTFDNFSSVDAPDILDKMTLSTQKSALNFAKLETALPIVSGAANAAGISFDRTLAILGKLSDAGIDASSSSTALRNIFLESAKRGESYEQILERISKSSDKLTASNDKFGKRAAVSSTILAGKLKETAILTDTLKNSFKGTSQEAANTRLDTFTGDITLLKSAYEGLLLDINDGTGALGIFRIGVQFVTKNIKTIAIVLGSVIGLFLLMKTMIFTSVAVMAVYNTILGISAFMHGGMTKAIASNNIALGAYKFAAGIAAAAQWILNTAMAVGLWPILAIIAAITAIILVIKNWSKIVDFFSEKWSKLTKYFKETSWTDIFKDIGKSIISFMLMPLKGVLKLVSMLPGKLGKAAESGLEKLNDFTTLSSEVKINAVGPDKYNEEQSKKGNVRALNSAEVTASNTTTETIKKNNLSIDIRDKGNNVEKVTNDGDLTIPINTTPTQGIN